jgi:hypothetical protein
MKERERERGNEGEGLSQLSFREFIFLAARPWLAAFLPDMLALLFCPTTSITFNYFPLFLSSGN